MKAKTQTPEESATVQNPSMGGGDQAIDDTSVAVDTAGDGKTLIDWQCFAYLTAEKSELYRAIIDVFATAKSEFTLHLRPAQVR